ncbi:ankyrin repeat-containing protein NPR4-like [Salvia miltiorrhiza]|uniref:ankyrin repeat-containing protein NPR4-like n=1 Tax=Salvia miltiorrhiza TaxID=226208 RepID=UPI0025ABAC79|nr:ankyrin repeat-containing protein NPR4-like [Salvia miltiorrhiza]
MSGEGRMAAELYDAVSKGDVRKFREVVQQDPYLVETASFACSRNVLHIAILWKRVAIVEEVLKINPQLARDLDSQQSSALHIAVAKGSLEIVKKLLSVAPEACWWRDCHDMNPIHIAAMNGHDEVLKMLLNESHIPAMERLHRGQTVLHLCVKHGKLTTLKVLVEKLGELVYAKDDNGETFLDLAVRCNQDEMVQHVVAMENNNVKVLVDLVDEVSYARSRNLLQIAILRGHVDMVEGLLNTNPQLARDLDSQQSSPLHIAVAKGSLEIVKKLLSVAPEACWWRDCHDMNPIHIAAMNGHVNILKVLLEESHMPAMERLHRGQTVLHLCVKHGQLDALKVLVVELGEFVFAVDDDGETLLHLAVRCNQLEILRYLWKSNKIIRIKRNSMGKTALQILDESPPATTPSYSEMRRILRNMPSELMFKTNMDNVMMVVAILIATMAFQNSVTPPGGVWQDDTPSHKAGQAVIAYTHPDIYRNLLFYNKMSFNLSFLVIFLITSGLTSAFPFISFAVGPAMGGSIMFIMLSYGFSTQVISPNTFDTPLTGYYIFCVGSIIAGLVVLLTVISWIYRYLRTNV